MSEKLSYNDELDIQSGSNPKLLERSLRRVDAMLAGDAALRRAKTQPEQLKLLQAGGQAAIDIFAKACEIYRDRLALGSRAFDLVAGEGGRRVRYRDEFTAITYADLWQRTVRLATGLTHEPRTNLKRGEIAGIYGFGSIDYVVADMACLYLGVTSAVLQTSMRASDLQHIVNEGAFATMICSREYLPSVIAALPACPSVRSVVVMDVCEQDDQQRREVDAARAELAGLARTVVLTTLPALERLGAESTPAAVVRPKDGETALATLMYTSGSTGFPKGAMITEAIWRHYWQTPFFNEIMGFPQIAVGFYPLSHVLGRNAVLRSLVNGGVLYFTLNSDMSSLFDDIRRVRPTLLELVPRVSDMIYQHFRNEVLKGTQSGQDPRRVEAAVRLEMRRRFLGDRLLAAFTGSAPTAPEVFDFIKRTFEIPFYDGYGSTEGGVITLEHKISHTSVSAFKLVDVPELGYRVSDQPYPRGELLVKTLRAVPGYFNNAEATKALYDDDGFLRTGDVMEQRGPDHFIWLDRKNNVLKLAQGEFVAIWRLETTFMSGSPYLGQVYLYGNSSRSYLLAVIVPAHEAVAARLQQEGKAPTPAAVKQLLRSELNRVASAAALRAYEVPRDFIVEDARFTRENGLLTGVNKPARPQLKKLYGERLEALYAQLEAQQRLEVAELSRGGRDVPVLIKVQKALQAVLGLSQVDASSGQNFKDLGGDSLHAVALAKLLEELCGVAVPVSAILNPGSSLLELVHHIEERLAGGSAPTSRPTFASVHGDKATVIRSQDLRLESFLSPAELAAATPWPQHGTNKAAVKTVLLTGATGFLGRFLALEWLSEVAKVGGKVYAVVRASHAAAAAQRLQAAFAGADAALTERFTRLAKDHLVVLAGDLAKPQLGLSGDVYERLCREVDAIVHPGALVNHVFSYEQLFEPNVLGTAELIRLALTGRPKRFDYVSTIGVLSGAKLPGKVPEREGVAALRPDWPLSTDYASGYATSKWASEVLLKELHERFGHPVQVFRPDMILPHRRYLGQINVPDMFTRLLASIVYTGMAPRSFYEQSGKQARQPHYDGLPVDFIARAMVEISQAAGDTCATYQVSNCHWDDGVSLDRVVDWAVSAGKKVERIADYAEWYAAFKAKLEALPEPQRQHSSLPILQQWAKPANYWEEERVDATQFRARVQALRVGGEGDIPHLDEAYIHKYLRDMERLGII